MLRIRLVVAVATCLVLARFVVAGDNSLSLTTAHGTVEKAEKDTLKVRPREADGKFGKTLVLKITGTSKITTLSQQKRAGKGVLVQRDLDVKDLEPHQPITVIYATAPAGPVLLSAVVQPAPGK
jgi:hypothetical protein